MNYTNQRSMLRDDQLVDINSEIDCIIKKLNKTRLSSRQYFKLVEALKSLVETKKIGT